jgi:hypothetical protein
MVNGTNNLYPKNAVDIVHNGIFVVSIKIFQHSNSGLALYQLFIELSFSVRYIFAFMALFSLSLNNWYFWVSFLQKQNMVNGTNNLYPKNAVDIVHEETNPKVPIV